VFFYFNRGLVLEIDIKKATDISAAFFVCGDAVKN
jgi:hypothetical protein